MGSSRGRRWPLCHDPFNRDPALRTGRTDDTAADANPAAAADAPRLSRCAGDQGRLDELPVERSATAVVAAGGGSADRGNRAYWPDHAGPPFSGSHDWYQRYG